MMGSNPEAVRTAAALVSTWPTWWVEAESESALLERIAAVGVLPQADILEPWPGEPWRARVVRPPLDRVKDGALRDGHAPGWTEWSDRGRIGEDVLEAGPLRFWCLSDLEAGGLLWPDLIHLETEEPVLIAIAHRLLAATGSGPDDQVELVRHRTTGRFGLLLTVAVPDQDPMVERQAVANGVADAWQGSLVPDLLWRYDFERMAVLGWLIHPVEAVLPQDRFAKDVPEFSGVCELQSAPDPTNHEARVLGLSERLGALGFVGSRARWIDGRFVACWTGPADAEVAWDGRRVPGCPPELESDWVGIDPAWFPAGGVVVMRIHCSLRDRDLLPVYERRDADPQDAAWLERFPDAEPIQANRPGLQFRIPAPDEAGWMAWVERLGKQDLDGYDPVAFVAMGAHFTIVLFRDVEPIEATVWCVR